MSKKTSYLTIRFNDRTNTRVHDTVKTQPQTGENPEEWVSHSRNGSGEPNAPASD